MLAHDAHPNRAGHALLRDQYLHALHRLGWVVLPDAALPALDPLTPVTLDPVLDTTPLETARNELVRDVLPGLDFTALAPAQTRAFLGGLFPESYDPNRRLEGAPWASLRAAFLLRRPTDRPLRAVEVEIEIPPRPELFPFSLRLLLDGAQSSEILVERPSGSGRYTIEGAPTVAAFDSRVVEVALETGSHFSTIDDDRMKSYRLLRAVAR
jgi:hypothetical protein